MNLNLRSILVILLLVFGFAIGMASLLNYFKLESTVKKLQRSRMAMVAGEVSDAMQRNLELGAALAESASLQQLIDRDRGADAAIIAIDIFDERGRVLFSTERTRAGLQIPDSWISAASRPVAGAWFVAEAQAFVTGLAVTNSFNVPVGGVSVRYQRAGLDASLAATRVYLGEVAMAVLVCGVGLTLLGLWALLARVRRDFLLAEDALSLTVASADEGPLLRELAGFNAGADAAVLAIETIEAQLRGAVTEGAR
jgi:sensor histidine kinase regulating citrate/malate metabolism